MSDGLLASDLRHVWHPFTQMKNLETNPPLVIDHAEGVWLYDGDGNRWLDGIASWWVNLLGHRHPRLDGALKAQIDKVAHVMFARFTHSPAILLAERLVKVAPPGLARVFYSDNGSTAVEVALKMAFQYWRNRGQTRDLFLSFDRAYHGDTLGAVSVGGVPTYHQMWAPLLFPVARVSSPHRYPRPAGITAEEDQARVTREVESTLQQNQGKVAAIIIEPLVQAAGEMATYDASFLVDLRRLADEYDTLLIFDEVATGFGRTGKLFAAEHAGVSPDLMCLSKAVTGGYMPLGVTLATESIFSAFYGGPERTLYHGHSYTGNPLATALGAEVLQIVGDLQWREDVALRGEHLQKTFRRLADHPHVGEVRGIGFVAVAQLVENKVTGAAFPEELAVPRRVCEAAWRRGLFIRPLGNVIYLWPPLVISPAQVEWVVGVMEDSLTEVVS